MRKIFTALTAVAVTASAIAQITGTLNPDGGKFYAGDLKYNGYIGIEYSAPVGHTEVTDSSYIVKRQIKMNSINNLGRGLYIVKGHKVLVK